MCMVPAEQEVIVVSCDKYQLTVKFHFLDGVNLFLLLREKIDINVCRFISEKERGKGRE